MEVNTPEHHTYSNVNDNSNKFSLKSENEDNIINNENCIDKSLDSNKIKDKSKYKMKYTEVISKCKNRDEKKYINDNEFICNLLLMPSFIDIPNKCSTFSMITYCYQENENIELIYSISNKIEKYVNNLDGIDRNNFINVFFRAAYFFQKEKNFFYAFKYIKKCDSFLDSSIQSNKIKQISKFLNEMENDLDIYIKEKKKKFENEIDEKICDKVNEIIQSIFVNKNNTIGNTSDNNDKYFYVINKTWLKKAMDFIIPFKTIMKDKLNEKVNYINSAFDRKYAFQNYFDENEKEKGIINKYASYPGPINNYPLKDFKDSWKDCNNLDENDFIKKELNINKDYMFINSCDWEFLKSIFDCTNEIKRTANYSDLIQLKFILFDRRINKKNNNMNLLKEKYIQINNNSAIRQLKDKILTSVNKVLNSEINQDLDPEINQVLNSEINSQQELSFYLLNKENKNILIEMVSAFYKEIQMYESLYIEKVELQDNNTLNDFFQKYDKKKHILILEIIQKGEMNYLIQLDKNYKCSECNKTILNINEKYNCDYCHFSLFCSSNCSNNSYDHRQIDNFLKGLMEPKFNLSEFFDIELKSILRYGTVKGNVGIYNSEINNCCNSVFQCLSHTEDLTKYFLMECHKKEAISLNDFSSNDIFLNRYYKFIDCIWTSNGYSYADGYGHNINIAVYNSKDYVTFVCNSNHIKDNNPDAFEFLSSFLRHLHKDLKRGTNMQINNIEEQRDDENDEIASKRYLDYFKSSDDSFICDLFTGLFKYTYGCSCGKKTIKYEKLKFLELPIPTKKSTTNIQFKLFTQNGNFIDIYMKADSKTEMKDLILKSISYLKQKKDKNEEKKDLENTQKVKIDGNLFNFNLKFVPDSVLYNSIQVIEFTKSLTMINIYKPSYENINKKKSGKDIPFDNQNYFSLKKKDTELIFFETDIKSNLKDYIDVYIYPVIEKEKEGLFIFNTVRQQRILSFPLIISVGKYQTLNQLEVIVQEKVKKILHEQAQNITNAIDICYPHFNDKWKNWKIGKCPICAKKVDNNLWCSLSGSAYMNMTFHKFLHEKNTNRPLILYAQSSFYNTGYELYRGMKLFNKKCELDLRNNITLYDALELMKSEEEEELVEAELCKKCNKKGKRGKTVEIYKAPYYLIVKIKRFKKKEKSVTKNDTFIDYKEVLNLEDFVVGPDKKKCIYDLYAVLNHKKSINSTHYSAFCKNLGMWFLCDEKEYKIIDNVVSKEAYLLFYKRRSI